MLKFFFLPSIGKHQKKEKIQKRIEKRAVCPPNFGTQAHQFSLSHNLATVKLNGLLRRRTVEMPVFKMKRKTW